MAYIDENALTSLRTFLHDELPRIFRNLAQPGPYPSADILDVMRAVATDAGIPGECADPFCRRGGTCRAKAGDVPPPCAELWRADLVRRANDLAEGLVLAWTLDGMRYMEFARQLDEAVVSVGRRLDEGRAKRKSRRKSGAL